MENCSNCGNPKKLLFTSWYCECEKEQALTWEERKQTVLLQNCNHNFNNPTMKCAYCGMDVAEFWQGLS